MRFAIGICTAYLISIILTTGTAKAFDDSDCASLKTVEIKNIQEPLKTIDDYTAARGRALQRAYQEAAARVTGLWVESSSRSETDLQQNLAFQSFNQLDKSELSGFVRPSVTEDAVKKIGDHDAVSLSLSIAVCVPKPDFLVKWRRDKAERERKPPKPADPRQAEWFDAKTGEALLWYWKAKDQTFSFFDNKGFHPQNGQPLQPVTAKVREEWQQQEDKARQERQAEQERKDREQRIKDQQEAQRLQQEVERRERLAHAPELCNQKAGNPNDPRRPKEVGSASYDELRADPQGAVEACRDAVRQFPEELRFKYQLARAYQVNDPHKALSLLKELTDKRYPAAFDNYGWLLLNRRLGNPSPNAAMAAFRTGASLGDPDSMFSLANKILDARGPDLSPSEADSLLQRAAALGHPAAQAQLVTLQQQRETQRDQQIRDEQTRAMMMQMFMGAVQGISRR